MLSHSPHLFEEVCFVFLGVLGRRNGRCSLLLVKELRGLLDTGAEEGPVLHDAADVLNWQIDDHTSDLGSLRSDQSGDVLVQNSANLILVVRILGSDGVDDLMAGNEVTLLHGHRLLLLLSLHLVLLGLHLLLLLGHWVHALVHWGSLRRLTHHLGTVVHGATLHSVVVAALTTVVGAHTTLAWLALESTVLATWSHGSALLLLHQERHALKKHLKVELELFLVGEVGPLGRVSVLLTELLEVMLITGSLVVELTDFLDLVVVDGQSLVVDGKLLLGGRGLIWLFEADESVEFLDIITGRVHLEALDLTKLGKVLAEFVLGHVLWEALNVQIASLLGALVLDGLTESLSLTIGALQGLLDVKLLVVWQGDAVDFRGSVQLGDGLRGATRSVLAVSLVLAVEADEGVLALIVGAELHGLDAAELLEESLDVLLVEVVREVLGVNVVVDFSELALISGLVLDHLDGVSLALGLKSSSGTAWLLEANETVATGLMVGVEGDLEGLDVTVAREVLLETVWGKFLGDFTHKDVVVNDLLRVGAKEVVIKGKSAGWLSVSKLEVAHLLASESELVFLGDGHDGRVERTVDVASDLRHTREDDAGLLLQDRCEAGRCSLTLWEVVQVEVVLGALSRVDCHFDFVLLFVDVVFCFCFCIRKVVKDAVVGEIAFELLK